MSKPKTLKVLFASFRSNEKNYPSHSAGDQLLKFLDGIGCEFDTISIEADMDNAVLERVSRFDALIFDITFYAYFEHRRIFNRIYNDNKSRIIPIANKDLISDDTKDFHTQFPKEIIWYHSSPKSSENFNVEIADQIASVMDKQLSQRFSHDNTLELEIIIPEGLTDKEAILYAKNLVVQLDDTHRALGGSGLMLDKLEATEVFSTAKVGI